MGICEVEELQAVVEFEDACHSPPGHATRVVSANSRPTSEKSYFVYYVSIIEQVLS